MLLIIGHTKENDYDGYDPHHHVMLVDITLGEFKQFHKETGKVFPDASLVTQILNPWRCPHVQKHMQLSPGGYDYRDYVEPQHYDLYATPGQHDGADVAPFPLENLGLKEAGRFKTTYININGVHSTCVVYKISKIASAPKYSLMNGTWVRIDNTTRQDLELNETFISAKEWQTMRPGYWPVIRNIEEIMKIFGLKLKLSELEALTRELTKYLRQEAKYSEALNKYNSEEKDATWLLQIYDQGFQNAMRQMLEMGDSALQIANETIDTIDQQNFLKNKNTPDEAFQIDHKTIDTIDQQNLLKNKNLPDGALQIAGTIAQQAIKEIKRTGRVYTLENHQGT